MSDSISIDELGAHTAAYLEAAQSVAIKQFGKEQVHKIPLLVTQTAHLMASIERNRILQEDE